MKKIYLVPTMEVVPVQITQVLCGSAVQSNVDFEYGGESGSGFVARGREGSDFDDE